MIPTVAPRRWTLPEGERAVAARAAFWAGRGRAATAPRAKVSGGGGARTILATISMAWPAGQAAAERRDGEQDQADDQQPAAAEQHAKLVAGQQQRAET